MGPFVKLLLIFSFFALFFVVGYAVTGNSFELLFNQEKCVALFSNYKSTAWILGLLLLIADLVLPIPATGVMAALGAVYGLLPGAIFSVTGSVGAGLIGYWVARESGKRKMHWIASEDEIKRYQTFFNQWGGYAIIIGRCAPILPEVTSILAGISRMKFSLFLSALIGGAVPAGFLFAAMGAYSGWSPAFGTVAAVLIPAIAWPIFIKVIKI
nr:VTT domain-containing protein [uncultured Desulfobacter sp.]